MFCFRALVLYQQGDAAFQRLCFAEAMSLAVASQRQLCLGPESGGTAMSKLRNTEAYYYRRPDRDSSDA